MFRVIKQTDKATQRKNPPSGRQHHRRLADRHGEGSSKKTEWEN